MAGGGGAALRVGGVRRRNGSACSFQQRKGVERGLRVSRGSMMVCAAKRKGDEREPPEFITADRLENVMIQRMIGLGAGASLYSWALYDLTAAVSISVGVAGSCVYWWMLCRDVEKIAPPPDYDLAAVSMAKWKNKGKSGLQLLIQNGFKDLPQKIGETFQNGLGHPRLLVPIAMTTGAATLNSLSSDTGVHIELNCLLGGFFVYRVALLYQVWKDLLLNLYKAQLVKYVPDDFYGGTRLETNAFKNVKRALEELQGIENNSERDDGS